MPIRSSDMKAAPAVRYLRLAAALAFAALLGACGGSGGSDGTAATSAGSTAGQTTVVVTPNDPATAGPAADALVPPGTSTDASATTTPARRPETVRCAP